MLLHKVNRRTGEPKNWRIGEMENRRNGERQNGFLFNIIGDYATRDLSRNLFPRLFLRLFLKKWDLLRHRHYNEYIQTYKIFKIFNFEKTLQFF
ncbi:hypothetical protein TSAR_000127 [Trichomalopsis sarcophagae]|uniref:Uncharacterized protein n=1 Tax=Trichomalopsis sarcophagae TaxID=543379 RepID=A0A232F6X9_9HYME|nr:hypothetical protein TSAR_000127 [Trichomalopsis sarcophagae]